MSQYYQRALRQMDLDRSDKIARAEENRRAFYAAHPELDDLESQIAAVTREALTGYYRRFLQAGDAPRLGRGGGRRRAEKNRRPSPRT